MSDRDRNKARYYSGKKPYKTHNYRTMMAKKTAEEYHSHELGALPWSELLRPYFPQKDIEGFEWEDMAPVGWSIPGQGSWEYIPYGAGPCRMACNDSMLDCEGGCTFVACICAQPPISAAIAWDDGGKAYIGGTTDVGVFVCTGDATDTAEGEFPSIGVEITDGAGDKQVVRVALVDCLACCEPFALSGAGTVNPSATWEGTISPACPDADVGVTSNSGCTLAAFLNPAGDTVSVTPGASDCGSFTVTVSQDSCELSESINVMINDTGQGGDYDLLADNCQPVSNCKQCRSTGAQLMDCYYDIYFYSGQKWCCRTDAPGLPGQCFTDSGCETGQSDCPVQVCFVPCFAGTHYCTAVTCTCQNRAYVWYNQWEWICTC